MSARVLVLESGLALRPRILGGTRVRSKQIDDCTEDFVRTLSFHLGREHETNSRYIDIQGCLGVCIGPLTEACQALSWVALPVQGSSE